MGEEQANAGLQVIFRWCAKAMQQGLIPKNATIKATATILVLEAFQWMDVISDLSLTILMAKEQANGYCPWPKDDQGNCSHYLLITASLCTATLVTLCIYYVMSFTTLAFGRSAPACCLRALHPQANHTP